VAWNYTDSTCGQWCADPLSANVLSSNNATCVAPGTRCKQPRTWLAATVDVAEVCSERCLRRQRPAEWSPVFWEELSQQGVVAYSETLKTGRDVALAISEWTGLLAAYQRDKIKLAKIRELIGDNRGTLTALETQAKLDDFLTWAS